MVVGYNFKTHGINSKGQNVKGDNFDECLKKWREYWEYDPDINTENFTATPIEISFDID